MRPNLSVADVQRLLEDPSPEARAEAAGKVAADYSSDVLSTEERQLAEQILEFMVKDAEVRVRQALSNNLKNYPGLSHDVARALADDVESVSLPILRFSQVLTDADLVEIVRTQGAEKQIAVAQRDEVSESLADALVQTKNEDVVTALVENEGADISEAAMQTVLGEFGDRDRVTGPMAYRAKLPVAVAERLVNMVSDTMKEHLLTHQDLPPEVATDLIMLSRERATLGLLSPGSDAMDVQSLVSQLHQNGRLSATIILRALCMGDLDFFEASAAMLTGLPLGSARSLIHDEGPLGLRAIIERSDLPEGLYPAFRAAVDVIHENEYDGGENDRERFRRRMIERILTQVADPTSAIGSENAEYLLGKLSQIEPGILGDGDGDSAAA